jgi:O-antigen ligase
MIIGGAALLSFIALLFLVINPQMGLLLMIAFKPIIDASWNYSVFGFNCLQVIAVGLPVILIFRMLFSNANNTYVMPLFWPWSIYVFANFLAFAVILSLGKGLNGLELVFRVLNGFVGFFMFQHFFSDKKWFRNLLIAYLIAGIFPMMMGAYQAATGTIWREGAESIGTGGLVRAVGVYHDAINFRHYAYMTITAILLYWTLFAKRNFYYKLFLTLYGAMCTLVIFRVYSKAGYLTLCLWILTWTFLNKKFGWLLGIILAVFVINFAYDNIVFKNIALVYSRETSVIEGTATSDHMFSGRVRGWQDMLKQWQEKDIIYKFFGSGTSASGAHNDYLRVLISGGIIGLFAYVTLLVMIGSLVFINLLRHLTALNIMAVMIFSAWIIDTIGLVPGIYPGFQWYVWGFIGLSLHGVKGLSNDGGEGLK